MMKMSVLRRKLLLKSSTVASYVPLMDVQIEPSSWDCAAGMEESVYARGKDVQIKFNAEEFALGMEQEVCAEAKDVQIMLSREVYA
jgi:hypothetical protein